MTTLILVRHAKPDPETRALSPEGREVQAAMSQRLHALGYRADQIISSPLIRAVQTAEILQQVLGGRLDTAQVLGDAFDADVLLRLLSPEETTLLVGHEPNLPAFARQLTGESILPAGMSKSSAAILTCEGAPKWGSCQLIDYLVPEQGG